MNFRTIYWNLIYKTITLPLEERKGEPVYRILSVRYNGKSENIEIKVQHLEDGWVSDYEAISYFTDWLIIL